MADPTTPPATEDHGTTAPPATPDPATGDEGKGGKAAVLADLATERDKRQALEQQVKQLTDAQHAQTDALAKAFGLKPEETSDVSALAGQVTTLQEQFTTAQHENAVLTAANAHGITDKDDLATLAAITDVKTMQAVAARIGSSDSGPGTPKPDLTQGGKGGGNAGSGSPEKDFEDFLKKQLGGN